MLFLFKKNTRIQTVTASTYYDSATERGSFFPNDGRRFLSRKSLRFKKRKEEERRGKRRGAERRELKRGVALFNGRHFSPVEDTGFPRSTLISSSLFLLSLPHPLLLPPPLFFLLFSLSFLSHSRESDLDPRATTGKRKTSPKVSSPPSLSLPPPTQFHSIWRLGNCFSIAASV